jgi:hypothetical protein
MSFTATLLACLAAGVIFATLAAWLTTTKGNTISDIAKSPKFGDAEAIKVEILDKVKLSSNLPIVGLYVVAAVVAVGLPAFIYWNTHREASAVVYFSGSVQRPTGGRSVDLYLRSEDNVVKAGTEFFSMPIAFRTEQPLILTIWGPDHHPVALKVVLDKVADALRVQVQGREDVVRLQEHRADLTKPIPLALVTDEPKAPNEPSPQPPLPATLSAAVPPAE